LSSVEGPKVAVTDFMRMVPDQVGRWVPGDYVVLGTDGFGRSDTRAALRRFFETDSAHVIYATLSALARAGRVDGSTVAAAADRFGIDTDSPPPWTR
jgi:pyruvate dehydrogenase E1 component